MADGVFARRLPSPLLTVVIAAVLTWFVLRDLGLAMLVGTAPHAAALLLPVSPEAQIAEATWDGLSMTTPAQPKTAAMLAAGMRNAPLLSEPFFAAAVDNRSKGRFSLAIRQMEEASRRNPRLVPPHLFLADQYVRAGRYQDALSRVAIALRLPVSEEGRAVLMRALYVMGREPTGHASLVRALSGNPPWRRSFVEYVMSRGGDPATLFSAVRSSPESYSADQVTDEREIFLNGLVRAGDYGRAYLAWVNFLPADALGRVSSVYDGTFRKLPGPAPFNWTLFSGESATAEMIDDSPIPPGSALAVNYFGSVRTLIASQTMLLNPGNYSLSITARGTNEKSMFSGSFVWELACLPNGGTLGRLAFDALNERPTTGRTGFAVPPDCKAQTLTLAGLPGETSIQTSAEFGAISVKSR